MPYKNVQMKKESHCCALCGFAFDGKINKGIVGPIETVPSYLHFLSERFNSRLGHFFPEWPPLGMTWQPW